MQDGGTTKFIDGFSHEKASQGLPQRTQDPPRHTQQPAASSAMTSMPSAKAWPKPAITFPKNDTGKQHRRTCLYACPPVSVCFVSAVTGDCDLFFRPVLAVPAFLSGIFLGFHHFVFHVGHTENAVFHAQVHNGHCGFYILFHVRTLYHLTINFFPFAT